MFVRFLIAFAALCMTFYANAALVVNQEASSQMNRDVYNKVHSAVQAVCGMSTAIEDPLTVFVEEIDRKLTNNISGLGPDNYVWTVSADIGSKSMIVANAARENRRTLGSAEKYKADCDGTLVDVTVTKLQ